MKFSNFKKGFTATEIMVVLGIFVLLSLMITKFEKDIFSFNSFMQPDLRAQLEGRQAIVRMVSEMREMSPSSLGSYPIAAAATSSITFYTNIDGDIAKEQVKYYVSGTKIMKSLIQPTGSPLVYDSATAAITTVVNDIANGTSTPIFTYYDKNYDGTSAALAMPVDISLIRLIKITLALTRKSSISSVPLTLTSNATPRNLKDNL